ncbi:MAG: sulfite exporter TauE/SafE family protein [Nitrosospira sp.]|nr:sulfite exporter TauE/SafE family protein [Nitrosospira sp.]MDN5939924.1 sulfite exporter TauE/SafE family protein [Salinisphaera sp.]
MEWWPAYLLLGAIVGFFAGLLGIGGGLIMVPVLTFIFSAQHFPPDRILHLALGTTMAAIIFTSASSLRAHHAHGAVNWGVVKTITPGIIVGTLAGATLVSALSSRILSIVFVVFIYYAATQMLLKVTPKPSRKLPGRVGMFGAGSVIGAISSFVAIGGGLLTVPFLSICNVKLQHAIGTAAAVGFPIAVTGAIGYIVNGMTQLQPLPEYSLGYVYPPALGWVVLASTLTAPLGAKTTHIMQTATLRKIFVVLLYLLGTKMLIGFF